MKFTLTGTIDCSSQTDSAFIEISESFEAETIEEGREQGRVMMDRIFAEHYKPNCCYKAIGATLMCRVAEYASVDARPEVKATPAVKAHLDERSFM